MRLTECEQQIIVEQIQKQFGESAKVWLFGSRVDDAKFGGDIDLCIEIDPDNQYLLKLCYLRMALEDHLPEQNIDIILHIRNEPEQPIHQLAKQDGILLSLKK